MHRRKVQYSKAVAYDLTVLFWGIKVTISMTDHYEKRVTEIRSKGIEC